MKKIVTTKGKFGPFNEVIILEDRYRADNADLPFSVVGQGTIEEALDGEFNTAPVRSSAEVQKEITDSTQARLDAFAKTRNYDGILSACTYATSSILKFKTEGQYCVDARDNTWAKLYQIVQEVQQGVRPAPSSFADIEPDLPVLTWPN